MHLAVSAGRFRITSLLLNAAGVDVNAVDHEGNTPAHYSCQRGDLQILELLMTSPQFASLTTLNMYRNSPIHAACSQGRIEVINHLLGTAALSSDSVGNMGSSPSSGGGDGRTITVPQDVRTRATRPPPRPNRPHLTAPDLTEACNLTPLPPLLPLLPLLPLCPP